MIRAKDKICLFIPAYNCEKFLPGLLDSIPKDIKERVVEILTIDDASEDGTFSAAVDYKKTHDISNMKILRNKIRQGYGGSQKLAYEYCIDKDYDIVAMLHGDGQYDSSFLDELISPIIHGEADMTIGSRMLGKANPSEGGMPLYKLMGNRILTKVENLVLGLNLSEYHSGFRAYNVEALKHVQFKLNSNDYHFDTEMIIQFKLLDLKIFEFPISTHYERGYSYLHVWSYGFNIVRALVEYKLNCWGLKKVKKFCINV